jgi:hypothetical protein
MSEVLWLVKRSLAKNLACLQEGQNAGLAQKARRLPVAASNINCRNKNGIFVRQRAEGSNPLAPEIASTPGQILGLHGVGCHDAGDVREAAPDEDFAFHG